ncbi:multiple epidermal growth factor-like domains protein 11 [Saccostrea cucullata]|uniref:multiple epidermal growth factor-like domains protein 11 n=1 Tax=Saccostrea cuccullata TaxID=36930 RepID=UPI002ED484BC
MENLALNKQTWQAKPYILNKTFHSGNAVDGLKTDLRAFGGQCAISNHSQKSATWWVNLGSVSSIHHIRIYYRTGNAAWDNSNGFTARFLGFYLYVSNTTNRLGGHLCFHDTIYNRSTIPAVINISCPVHGQYVIYYNERPQSSQYAYQFSKDALNELCEVEVFGCNVGFYAPNCSSTCPSNCQHPFCNIETGACQDCKPGFKGSQCDLKCNDRYYGENCISLCGDCLNFEECHHVNGSCLNGYDAGFFGEKCDRLCPVGLYGRNCERTCSINCLNTKRCDSKSGACQGGCKTGWREQDCEHECDSNMFGVECSKQCGHCRDGSQCHYVNGTCLSGCDSGYTGDACTEACGPGMYGIGCKQKCSAFCSVSGICDHVTGACKQGCKSGWMGLDCLEVKETTGGNTALYIVSTFLCICITVIAVLVVYIIRTRGKNRELQTIKNNSGSKSNRLSTVEENYDSINCTSNMEYQELGVIYKNL